jgi:hypothetical protein
MTLGTTGLDETQTVNAVLTGESITIDLGEVQLKSTDPGLVALGTAVAGLTTPKSQLDLYNLLKGNSPETGITIAALPNVTLNSYAFTNAVLTAVEDQITHYLGVKDVILNAVEDQRVHYIATASAVTSATLQSAQTSTGVGTAFTVTGQKMVAIQVTSTVVGTITYDFEVSIDGTNFQTGIDAVDMLGADNLGSITQTGAGTWIYQIMCAGITKIQCNITANAATGGTSVTVTGQAVA